MLHIGSWKTKNGRQLRFLLYDNSQLRQILTGTPFHAQNIVTLLLRIDGAVGTRRRFGPRREQCVFVPLRLDEQDIGELGDSAGPAACEKF